MSVLTSKKCQTFTKRKKYIYLVARRPQLRICQKQRLKKEFIDCNSNTQIQRVMGNKQQKGDYKGAIENFSLAIKMNPRDAVAYNNRGVAKVQLQDYLGAIEDYSQAIRLKPDYAFAYNNRGNSKYQLKKYSGAIEDYSQAIKLNPDFFAAYNGRGNSKRERQEQEEAIEDYSQAIRLNPDYAIAYNNRGNSKDSLKKYQGAIKDYNRAIQLKPDYADAYYNRGHTKDSLKKYQGAIEDYSQAIRLYPDHASAYIARGNSKQSLQDYKSAQSDFLAAISLRPQSDPLCLFNLANLYLDMGQKDEALKRYKEGVKCFQRQNEANLKRKFFLSDGNIRYIKSSIQNFEKLTKQVEEIKQQAQRLNRPQVLQQLVKINAAIASACIKSADEKANQTQTQKKVKTLEEQLKVIKKRLVTVQGKVDKLEAKVDKMGKFIYADKRILEKIGKIDSRNLSEFYKLLYNILINHFMSYRMLSTGFFMENVREVTTFDSIVGKVCKAQPIIESIPILGDLVGIPFKILGMVREEKSSRLNSVIADKINGSKLQSEARITSYMSHLVEVLINNNAFNNKLMKAIQEKEASFINKAMDVFGQLKEKIHAKAFGGATGEFSYVQQAVTLYMARFTLQLYDVKNDQFNQHCKSEESFSEFFMNIFGCLPEKKAINPNDIKFVVDLSQPASINELGNTLKTIVSPNKPLKCWERFLQLCCCISNEPKP